MINISLSILFEDLDAIEEINTIFANNVSAAINTAVSNIYELLHEARLMSGELNINYI